MAEPKPAPEKPNLVAVASEPRAEARATSSAPALGRPAAAAPQEQKGTPWGLWLLALLLLGAVSMAWVQSQRLGVAEGRVTALSEQVLGLQAQLSAANTQIQTYEMQRGQVREAVSDIAQRVLVLNELLSGPAEPVANSEVPIGSTP